MKEINMDERLPDGSPRYRTHENGSVQDMGDPKRPFVKSPDVQPITKDNAREMQRRAWDKRHAKAIEGAAAGLKVPNDAGEVTKAVFEKVGGLLDTATNARGAAEAARFIVDKAKLLPPDETPTVRPESALAGLLGLALGIAAQRGEIIDADVTDGEAEDTEKKYGPWNPE